MGLGLRLGEGARRLGGGGVGGAEVLVHDVTVDELAELVRHRLLRWVVSGLLREWRVSTEEWVERARRSVWHLCLYLYLYLYLSTHSPT